ncbi:MAG: hypothetical protein WBN13_05600 [Robiginitalea sp.]|uniref:hypothetical protein n=1 Tax=Robiginitalea sp. TaxID=1902411 RepID=UPI003C75FFBE
MIGLNDWEVRELYEKQISIGLAMVHAQDVYLFALKRVMEGWFGRSGIAIDCGDVFDYR